MEAQHQISNAHLSIDRAIRMVRSKAQLKLSESSREAIEQCRAYLDQRLEDEDQVFYGINTGFGSLCDIVIPSDKIEQLQYNLVRSHACGVGETIPEEIVRLMLLLKIQNLSYGHSGVQTDTVEALIHMFNSGLSPVIHKYGSLGASGDLAPLAHLSLPLLGEGAVFVDGAVRNSADVIDLLKKVELKAKEGLALLNGTQFMSAFGCYNVYEAYRLYMLADFVCAVSLDAYGAKSGPFDPLIHKVRNQLGQQTSAAAIRKMLDGSALFPSKKKQTQDPYSFRCSPQVHGASLDAIDQVKNIVEREMNATTDNPLIFNDENEILSGGNFHGQPLALHLDFLKLAVSELGNISERRTFKLLNGVNGLPDFLVHDPGLNSGMMIPQYTAASLVSANKQLCSPASIDSITSSNGQEDHVSMGANAATQCFDIIQNVWSILSIEFLCACQALEFRGYEKTSPFIKKHFEAYREKVSFNTEDRILADDIAATTAFLQNIQLESIYDIE